MEVVPSSSPFGRVLKDHNLRRPTTTNAAAASKSQPSLQKTLQELVREHLRSSISNSSSNENSIKSSNGNGSGPKAPLNPNSSNSSSVSCLVRKWKGFETFDPNQQQLESDNDSVSDWESDQAPMGERENVPDVSKKEKIRVVDIIRKLPLKVPLKQMECGELYSPKIRGRQAVAALFARMARDRYEEVEVLAKHHSVSDFPKRGRIQSFLKYRLLRGEAHYQAPKGHELRKSIQQRLSSVNSLRRRFSKGSSEKNDFDHTTIRKLETSSNDSVEEKAVFPSNQPSAEEETNDSCQEEINLGQISDGTLEINHQEEDCIEDITNQEQEEVEILDGVAKSERNNQQQAEDKENFDSARSGSSTDTALQAETEDRPQEIPAFNVIWQESGSDEEAIDDYGSPNNVWEEDYGEEMGENEEYYDNDDFFESSLDWIHDISRPHGFWESRRQARYQEICESSTNNDILQLIERGSVSAVLASDFRDRMDQLMISSVQLQSHPIDPQEDEDRARVAFLQSQMQPLSGSLKEEEEQCQEHENHHEQEEAVGEEDVDENGDMEDEEDEKGYNREQSPLTELPWTFFQEHENQHEQEEAVGEEDVDENGDMEDEEDEEEYNHEQSPSTELPWSSYQEQEDRDNLERIESQTHRQESFATISYDHDSQVGSSIKNGSTTIEMELISDIRSHMQQIYSEMTELRKAVNSCMDMQSSFQSSIREEVSAAISHIKVKESKRKAPKKGSCRICHKKNADSLLYRCGHMCTCFECAHELQWSSGKCPICWAEIVDVVRVCTDYY